MKTKRMIYTILFCMWIGLNYIGIFRHSFHDLADNLAKYREPPLYLSTFQLWFFDIASVLFDSLCIAVATGIFAYHYRKLTTWHYVALALFIRYFLFFALCSVIMLRHSLSEILDSLHEFVPTSHLVIMGLIQLSLAIVAAFVGIAAGRDADYLDDKDDELGYIGGVSKKIWALLLLLFNPVARFATKLSIVFLYKFTRDVTSRQYWSDTWDNLFWGDERSPGGIVNLILNFFYVALVWTIAVGVFWYGIQTVRDKEADYRLLKILAIFVALPAVIIAIPLIRNRTWFF